MIEEIDYTALLEAGKLKDQYYWVKDSYGHIYPARFVTMQQKFAQFLPRVIVEVVAPCDYEELQRLKEDKEKLSSYGIKQEMKISELSEINKQLHQLLKDCHKYIDDTPTESWSADKYDLLDRINEVLK